MLDVVLDAVHDGTPQGRHDAGSGPVAASVAVSSGEVAVRVVDAVRTDHQAVDGFTGGGNPVCACGWTGGPGHPHSVHVAQEVGTALADAVAVLLTPRALRDVQGQAWDQGYEAGEVMARRWGHVDDWEDEPTNPYTATPTTPTS